MILSSKLGDPSVLQRGLRCWERESEPRFAFDGHPVRSTIVNDLVCCKALPGHETRLVVVDREEAKLRELGAFLQHGLVQQVDTEAVDASAWQMTVRGVQQLRHMVMLGRSFPVVQPRAGLELEDSSNWELLHALDAQGWQMVRAPTTKAKRRALLPHIPGRLDKQWFNGSVDMNHQRLYLIALLSSQTLFDGGRVTQVHHLRPAAYYKKVLAEQSSGEVADEEQPVLLGLELDVEPQFALVDGAVDVGVAGIEFIAGVGVGGDLPAGFVLDDAEGAGCMRRPTPPQNTPLTRPTLLIQF